MDRFYLTVSFVVISSCCSCNGQMMGEEHQQIITMKHIFEQNKKLLQLFEGQQVKIKSLEDGHRTMMDSLQDMQTKMEIFQKQQTNNQSCAKQDQIDDFKMLYEAGKQEIMTSLEQYSCRDQLPDLQVLLETDECGDGSNKCSNVATCTDQQILYKCVCLPGFSGDGFTCTDVDECTENSAKCRPNETCSNTPGSYECLCPVGYKMADGGCQEIDCKSPSLYLKDLGCITMLHNNITWEEAEIQCKTLGMRFLGDFKKEHFDPIIRHFMPLRDNREDVWVGFRYARWLSSGRSVSSELLGLGEDYLEDACGVFDMTGIHIGLWDRHCTNRHNSLCQKRI